MKKVKRISIWVSIILVIIITSCKKEKAIGSTLNDPQKRQITIDAKNTPIFVDKNEAEILSIRITIPSSGNLVAISNISCVFTSESNVQNIAEIKFYCTQFINGSLNRNLIGNVIQPKLISEIKMNSSLITTQLTSSFPNKSRECSLPLPILEWFLHTE